MLLPIVNFPVTPINPHSQIIEERYFNDLVKKAYDSTSIAPVYIRQVPNIRAETKSKPMSKRMSRLKKAGLIGSLNDTGVTSSNYKEIIMGSSESEPTDQ